MPRQDDDMTLEELDIHMRAYIEEMWDELREDVRQYNLRKKLYEESAVLA